VAAVEDGTWTFVPGRDELGALRGLDADDALAMLHAELGDLTPAYAL
jgi:hypothetical protein